jgi:hypothetical protein
VVNNRLLGCAWFDYPGVKLTEEKNNRVTNEDIEVKDIYCHIKTRKLVQAFLYIVIDAVITDKSGSYFLTNKPLFCQALEAMGLQTE